MDDKPKRKGSPVRYKWLTARSHPIPFSYPVNCPLDHLVYHLQGFRLGIDYFVLTEKLLSPDYREYHFTIKAGENATGHIVEVSDTTCLLEGTIIINMWPLYLSFIMILVGAVVFPTSLREHCGFPLLLAGIPMAYAASPFSRHHLSGYHRTLELLETAVQTIESISPVYKAPRKINPHSVPKHSRPSNSREYKNVQETKRKGPS